MFPDYANRRQLNECEEVVFKNISRDENVEVVPFLSLSYIGKAMTENLQGFILYN